MMFTKCLGVLGGMYHFKSSGEQMRNSHFPVVRVDFEHVRTVFTVALWIMFASIAKIGFNVIPRLRYVFPESCLLIIVGVVINTIELYENDAHITAFTPYLFTFYMLPPIVLNTGYFMPNRLFFENLSTIMLFVVAGTLFNIGAVGFSLYAVGLGGMFNTEHTLELIDSLLFASILSAVEPSAVLDLFEQMNVKEIVYIMILGESIVNDAIVLVVNNSMGVLKKIGTENLIAEDLFNGTVSLFLVVFGGTAIGIIYGFLTALGTRFTENSRVIEPGFIFVMAYLSYLTAEAFRFSGVLSLIACSVTMKSYIETNISETSAITVKYFLKMLSSSSQTIIFIFVGMESVKKQQDWDTRFVVLTIIFCTVYRFIGVFVLITIANIFRFRKFSKIDKFLIAYGGLRGAVTFALALLVDGHLFKQKTTFITTTIIVIYFTVFIQGITLKPLIKFFSMNRESKRRSNKVIRIQERFNELLTYAVGEIVGHPGMEPIRDKFKRFDDKFIRPVLVRDMKAGAHIHSKVVPKAIIKKQVRQQAKKSATFVDDKYEENEEEEL